MTTSRCALCGEQLARIMDTDGTHERSALWCGANGKTVVVHAFCKRRTQAHSHGGRTRPERAPRGPELVG